jgi:hypothetical protein
MSRIDTVHARSKLAVRREPYWHKLPSGGYLGYRKSKSSGTWIARWRDQAGKQKYASVGPLKEWESFEHFKEAARLAGDWVASCSAANPATGRLTVDAAADARMRWRHLGAR